MHLVHWPELQPTAADLQGISLTGLVPLRTLLRALVRTVLGAYPWQGRADLVPLYDPTLHYTAGQVIALPIHDPQGLRPDAWQFGTVLGIAEGKNPLQGRFQVVILDVEGKKTQYAAGISGATPPALTFPPKAPDDLDWLVSHFADAYAKPLHQVVERMVASGQLAASLYGEQALMGGSAALFGEEEQYYLTEIFERLLAVHPWLTTDQALAELRTLGELAELPDAIARFVLAEGLAKLGYVELGEGQWVTPKRQAELDRPLNRRLSVPRQRSRVAKERGEAEGELEPYAEATLPEEAHKALEEIGEAGMAPITKESEWLPPSTPIQLPTFTYLHIREGYFPLDQHLAGAFDPRQELALVSIQVIEGDRLPFLVNRREGVLKALELKQFQEHFKYENNLPPGTRLWLEYQGAQDYRIAPRPLPQPMEIPCKLLRLDEQGHLHVEEVAIPVLFESEPNIFRAELRFEDMDALFAEAKRLGWSIFDAIYYTFEELAAHKPDVELHSTDAFNIVFVRYRMCSPDSVLAELYKRPCFIPVGNGRFRFDPTQGVKPLPAGRTRRATIRGSKTPVPVPEVQASEQAASYFIFQQREQPEYADRPGTIYNWRQGIPGANQIAVDSRFVYYRTGQKVFFGTGNIERIETYQGEDGQTYFNGHIAGYQPWDPALPLTEKLAQRLSFISPGRLWVGQAGIRQISQADFQTLMEAAEQLSAQPVSAPAHKPEAAEVLPTLPQAPAAQPVQSRPAEPEQSVSTEFTRKGQGHFLPQGPLFGQAEPAQPALTPAQPPAAPPPAAPASPPDRSWAHIRQERHIPKGVSDMTTKTLFSLHYLENRLAEHAEWQEDPGPAMARVRALWQTARQYGENWSEAQTEDEFVKPVLEALGWAYIVQPKSVKSGQVTRPDYALFANEQIKQEAYPHQGNDDAFYSRVLAVAEAKYWERPLSKQDKSGRNAWKVGENPSHQMVGYLVGTRCPWGILTNGATWRLYSREVSSTASEFYEINLADLFDFLPDGADPSPEQVDHFRRWWLFFRQAAFLPGAQGKSFVQRVHEGSTTYARQVSDKLKELVFSEVMPQIAGGFVAYRYHEKAIQEETPEALQTIYQASLSLLYKLLFLLYAEARGLLPLDNPGYQRESLTALAQWAAGEVDRAAPLSTSTYATPRYDALLSLFKRIDRGDPSLGIPRYNGGLFSPASPENQFLEQHRLPDQTVARAVDTLVRDAGQPVDYAYISVRNLGAIYEGLLENKLHVTDAASGKVALVNDKGERKATGSYYTPDYIVEYIVQHTLDPILDARQADYEQAMVHVTGLRQKLEKVSDHTTAARLRGELEEAERQAREAFLGIKVLDPAMGSGHFLVNAVDHLTDGIIQHLQTYHAAHPETPWDWDPIQQLIERVRIDILAEMQAQGIAMDPNRLDDTALLTRLVMKRCLYGVDLNRMAVELAKLSLWLHSFTVGAPLSFLDHHLRWGNSLIGADVRGVDAAIRQAGAGQMTMWQGPFAGLLDLTALMVEVIEKSDATLADVRQSAETYEKFQQALLPYKQTLDLWVSQYFGNQDAKEFLTLFGADVIPAIQSKQQVAEKYQQTITRARSLWQEKRFFHWDLEFPEVFVNLRKRDWAQRPGFDAVIGNPPYDELSEDARGSEIDEMVYLQSNEFYAQALGHRVNLYRLFIARSLNILTDQGCHGFIVPLSLLADQFTLDLREFILQNTTILLLEQFPQKDDPRDRIFYEAKLSTCLYVIQKSKPNNNQIFIRSHPGKSIDPNSPSYKTLQSNFEIFDPGNRSIPGLGQNAWDLILKLATSSQLVRLGTYINAVPGELMINKVFQPYLTDEQHGEEIIRGSHISRFQIVEPKQGEPLYLNRSMYLSSRREGSKAFHFQRERVVYQRYAAIDNYRRLIATILPAGYFCSHTIGYFSEIRDGMEPGFFVALLNTTLLDWRFNLTSTNNNINSYEIEALPIPKIDFTTPANIRSAELARAKEMHATGDVDKILELAKYHLPKQIDIIHDLLAYLANQMIALHKERQGEVKGLLTWLERTIGAKLEELTGKTIIQNYLGDYQKGEPPATPEQILAVLRKNQTKLGVDVAGRVFQQSLAKEYQESLDKLLPIKQKLAATDHLIDQIVYQLYGLTDDEIAIVEGTKG